ncbi:MAG: ATP-grasp domain-containing protein [Candidatus Woesearchaeota archaeon]|nr:ATP-grasp domain-containing protein [Candidatus Woesearchaeota archaeon]
MKIAILYNTIDAVKKGKEIEKIADNEVLETVAAVKKALHSKGYDVEPVKLNMNDLSALKKYDAIFNLAESVDGETTAEIKIIEALESLKIPFTGNNSYATRLCLDKEVTKKILLKNKIPTPKYQIFKTAEDKTVLKYPMIVKPLHEDASIGIDQKSYVTNAEELKRKVKEILVEYKQPALVEEYIDGQEINAAILGNDEVDVLPLSEIVFEYPEGVPKFLTFESKWIEDSIFYKNSNGRCPAEVDAQTEKRIIGLAVKCFKLMGCRGYARVDFRVKDGIPYVLEVNPNPCINPNGTGFIRSANKAGIDYASLMERILKYARSEDIERYSVVPS